MRWSRKSGRHGALPGRKRDEADPVFAYRVHWVQAVLDWPGKKRETVLAELEQLLADDHFEANPFQRRYHLRTLDRKAYAGESLQALWAVLRDWGAKPNIEEEQDG